MLDGVGQLEALHFPGAAFASATTAARQMRRALIAETVRRATVWADTTRRHSTGQEGGLIEGHARRASAGDSGRTGIWQRQLRKRCLIGSI
jgi:hypothetical protein